MDLNDARVQALKVATDNGLSIALFNEIWRLIVPAAIESGTRKATQGDK